MKKRPKKIAAPVTRSSIFHLAPAGVKSDKLPPLPVGHYWYRESYVGRTVLAGDDPSILDVGGFKFDDAPARWALQPADLEYISGIKLLRQFRAEARWWRKPAAWLRNPEKNGISIYGDNDIIIAVYGKNFHITIERYGNEQFGPHPCRLYYRSYQVRGEMAWVGIVQIEAFWHSDERMLKALNHEIKNRRFYQSDKTATTPVLV